MGSFGKHSVKGYVEGLFAKAKLQRLGNVSLIAGTAKLLQKAALMEPKRHATAAAFRASQDARAAECASAASRAVAKTARS